MTSTPEIKCLRLAGSQGGATSDCTEISIPADDSVFSAPPTMLSSLWELPLVVRQENPSQQGNQHITWLMLDLSFGVAPPQWQGGIGDAIVARQDKKDLSLQLLGAILDYISRLLDAFRDGEPAQIGRIWSDPKRFRKAMLKALPQLQEREIRSELPIDWVPKPSPPPLLQVKALKATGREHFVSGAFSAARSSYLAAWQLITRAYSSHEALDDDEVVEMMHTVGINIAIACTKLDDPKYALIYADSVILFHPLAAFGSQSMAKAYYTRGVARLNDRKRGATDLGVRSDLFRAKGLMPNDPAIQKALNALDALELLELDSPS